MNYDSLLIPPREKGMASVPLTMEHLWWIRQNPYSHTENVRMYEEHATVIEEMAVFKAHSGSCIVDNTTACIGRNLPFLKRVSSETGVHVIAATGYYTNATHPNGMGNLREEDLCMEMVNDVTNGCDGTAIKCGVIGELGCSWPITENERKVLRSAAEAQKQLGGCAVTIQPGRHKASPEECLRLFAEAGGDIHKAAISHIDRTLSDYGDIAEIAAMGAYCVSEYFGQEASHYEYSDIDMPSDAQRIQIIRALVEEGLEKKVLLSLDINTKHRLVKYGGHGYSHIQLNVLPKMRSRGLSDDVINRILVQNPRTWLQF